MARADSAIFGEIRNLDLDSLEINRQRHAAPGSGGLNGGGGNGKLNRVPSSVLLPGRFQPDSASASAPALVTSIAGGWTNDPASIVLARLLYGGTKQFVLAAKSLTKSVEAEEAERIKRERAATILQSAARGRRER